MEKSRSKRNFWLAVIAIVLIVLLLVWLTIADLWGDTDVNCITPVTNLIPLLL